MLPVPTISDLAEFTGRGEATFTTFASQALAQATLLFSIVTRRTAYPDDADSRQLATNAILQMADCIYTQQPYADVKARPFTSETIGSYSYSKANTALITKARQGECTGLFWWDLALDELSLVDRSMVTSGAIHVYDNDIYPEIASGRSIIHGPADVVAVAFDSSTEHVHSATIQ